MHACPNCTAPREAGLAVCRYCKTPYVEDVHTEAVQCPQCGTYCDIRATNCVKCKAWVVVQCVFCHAVTPHHLPNCSRCGEPFAGAAQRWQARQAQQQQARNMKMISTVGTVAASFLGAAAGAAIFDGDSDSGVLDAVFSNDDD